MQVDARRIRATSGTEEPHFVKGVGPGGETLLWSFRKIGKRRGLAVTFYASLLHGI